MKWTPAGNAIAYKGRMPEVQTARPPCAEEIRLARSDAREENWQRWGTYLPERQWGTVREDYSADGNPWTYFPFDMAQYRAFRWGEDGLLGWTDRECRLCFSTSLWNGKDRILKERLFGLTNPEGNHGEDVKEQFYYLDATPTHSYARALYKYPQGAFPYDDLRAENKRRGFGDIEYELLDTGIFDGERYFDVQVEYAKAGVEDMLIRLTITNRGPDPAEITVLPTLTLRNTWSWKNLEELGDAAPFLQRSGTDSVTAHHRTLGDFILLPVSSEGGPAAEGLLLTGNETNFSRLDPNYRTAETRYTKDAFDRYIVHGDASAVDPGERGTKAAFVYRLSIDPGQQTVVALRLARIDAQDATGSEAPRDRSEQVDLAAVDLDGVFADRIREADEFYAPRIPKAATEEETRISRQAYAGLLWSKQFYHYVAEEWLRGDALQPPPPTERLRRASAWEHLFCRDILSMPDKWEYPWFAAWDTAFHMLPMVTVDPGFAKAQMLLFLREWYMHPNGQIPAYEFAFSDVNPPVHPWAVLHVYREAINPDGSRDLDFLERAFQKLMLNFTWWVNRNDARGRNLFGGGFLGLDNIGVFDRSQKLPDGTTLDQADATAWMGLYCSCMLEMALELAQTRPAYEDIASKFFEHYIAVVDSLNSLDGSGLWDEEEGFYFDRLSSLGGPSHALKVRTIVGIVPLFAICIVRPERVQHLHGYAKRTRWFVKHRPQLASYISSASETADPHFRDARFLALVPKDRLVRILRRVFDESEFLSPYGIRSMSRAHREQPFEFHSTGKTHRVSYVPAEGDSGMFGGNSNWRGPIWFPINMLLINALERYHMVYGDAFRIEFPTGSGDMLTLQEVAEELDMRLLRLFLPDSTGHRPCHGAEERYASDPNWRELLLFNEYFSGDDGRGVGASHQTGWTALIATLIRARYNTEEARISAQ